MTKLTKEVFEKIKSEHPAAKAFSVSGVQVVLRPLTRPEFDKLTSKIRRAANNEESLTIPNGNAVKECLLHPTVDEFSAIMEEKPGLAFTLGAELQKMAGVTEEVEELTFL